MDRPRISIFTQLNSQTDVFMEMKIISFFQIVSSTGNKHQCSLGIEISVFTDVRMAILRILKGLYLYLREIMKLSYLKGACRFQIKPFCSHKPMLVNELNGFAGRCENRPQAEYGPK